MIKKHKISLIVSFFALGFLWSQTCVSGSHPWRGTVGKIRQAVVHVRLSNNLDPADLQSLLPKGHSLDDFFRHFQGFEGMLKQKKRVVNSQGSAFIVKIEGRKAYAVTNNHIIENADEMTITLDDDDSKPISAKVRGRDPRTDLAVIEFNLPEGFDVTPLRWTNSDDIHVGDSIMAAGYPFGFKSFSAGIVSNIFSGLPVVELVGSVLQIDAMANPGSSGGPAITPDGYVAGVVFSIATTTQANVGITFVIPANVAKRVTEQLIYLGKTKRGWLGVQVQPVSDDIAKTLGMKKTLGAMVVDVVPKGPADMGEFKSGDVIIRFNDRDVKSSNILPLIVGRADVGDKVPVVVWREGKEVKLSVTLGEYEQAEKDGLLDAMRASPKKKKKHDDADTRENEFGMRLRELTDDKRKEFGVPSDLNGVLITGVEEGSLADNAGLQPGYVILRAITENNRLDIKTPAELSAFFSKTGKEGKDSIVLYIWSPRLQRAYLSLRLKKDKESADYGNKSSSKSEKKDKESAGYGNKSSSKSEKNDEESGVILNRPKMEIDLD
ncbi:PDZ domain-containing protein [Alphaproteobacteria bacterium]|nr:PDZ domain-containing protein [Alphaproteobacteria bacterium]